MKTPDVYKRQARILKALAHESRLLIVEFEPLVSGGQGRIVVLGFCP